MDLVTNIKQAIRHIQTLDQVQEVKRYLYVKELDLEIELKNAKK